LRCDPVLAVSAVQVAAQHPEAVGKGSRISVKERFFLDGVALHAANIAPGHVERSSLVVTYFADSGLALRDRTTVATCITADPIAVQLLVEIAFADLLIENFPQRGHKTPCFLF
jgi:hypothetical protein